MEVLDSIPVKLESGKILKYMRLRHKNKQIEEMVRELVEVVQPLARPKAIYEVSYIDNKNGDTVTIDGVRFASRLLRVNLDTVERVFPYVATCGKELEEVAVPSGDIVKSFCLDSIKTTVLGSAINYLSDYLKNRYALGKMSHMNPGSLESWPITQQKELFSLFGDVESLVGVRLTEGSVMYPLKSVSGIYYPTEISFESCQLCPREKCIGRRAPYDPELAKKY
jgi:hypothetical protein